MTNKLAPFLAGAATATLVVAAAPRVISQDAQEEVAERPSMAEVMALAQPGDEHELLASLAGDGTMEFKMWMTPDAEPMVVEGTSTAKTILGGRFLLLESQSEVFGMQTETMMILGYDRRNEVFTSAGYDTMGTYGVFATGTRNAETGIISMDGVDDSPMGRQTWTMEVDTNDPDQLRFSILFHQQGDVTYDPPFKMVEVTSRKSQ